MAIFSDLPCDILIEIGDWLTYEDKEERDEVPHINSKLFADYAALLRVSRKCYEDLAYWFYHKISIQAIPRRGCTYIHYMAASGCDIAIRRLLGFNPKLLHQIGERDLKGKVPSDYMRPIHYAAEGGHLSTYKLLESEGDDPGALPSSKTEPSKYVHITALTHAARGGHFEIVSHILDKDGWNMIWNTNKCHDSPLFWAAAGGHIDVLNLLVEHGADPLVRSGYDRSTPLHYLVDRRRKLQSTCSFLGNNNYQDPELDPAMVHILLGFGIRPTAKVFTREKQWIDALELAVLTGQFTIVETLLNCPGIIPDESPNSRIAALLCRCIKDTCPVDKSSPKYRNILKLLLSHPGLDPNLAHDIEFRPLHLACYHLDSFAVRTLLRHPSTQVNKYSQRLHALHCLVKGAIREESLQMPNCKKHTSKILACLYTRVGHINVTASTVGSPLHIAVMFQCLWMVELLLEYGADINLRAPPSAGWGPTETPLDLAMIQGDDAIVQVMMQRAVDDSNSMDWEEDNPYDEERKPDSNPEGEESGDKDGEWVDPTTGEPAEHLDNVNYLDNLLDLEL